MLYGFFISPIPSNSTQPRGRWPLREETYQAFQVLGCGGQQELLAYIPQSAESDPS